MRDEASAEPATRSLSTSFRVFRAIGGTLAVLALLVGGGVIVAAGLWLADMERHPRQPPGQIVGIIPLAGVVVGAALACVGIIGLVLLVWLPRWWARRPPAQ